MELVIRIDTNTEEDISDLKIMADALNKKLAPLEESDSSKTENFEKKESLTNAVSVEPEPAHEEPKVVNSSVLPTTAAKEYTRDEIARAMVQLRDLKGVPELMSVLEHFGVNNLMAIPSDKYNELVAILNEKGVKV